MKLSTTWVSLLAIACRWGGPDGDPSDLFGPWPPAPTVEQPATVDLVETIGTAGSPGADTASDDGPPSAPPAPAEPGDFTSIDEAGPDVQGGVPPDGDRAEDGDGVSGDAGSPPLQTPPARCAAPADLVCDPVSNDGCLPLTQCVVDPNAAVATGYCVVASFSLDTACTQDLLSTSCPPQHTCIAGQCREYCYCDADCDDGAACTDPSGQGGSDAFKLCALEP